MQFRKKIKYLEDKSNMFEITRYILNITDSKKILLMVKNVIQKMKMIILKQNHINYI